MALSIQASKRARAVAVGGLTAAIGAGTRVWQLAHARRGAIVECDCPVGRSAYVGPGVRLGDNVKVQNYSLVYDLARLGHRETDGRLSER